jgi:hypothetical protein
VSRGEQRDRERDPLADSLRVQLVVSGRERRILVGEDECDVRSQAQLVAATAPSPMKIPPEA